jgi:hypothetical protein
MTEQAPHPAKVKALELANQHAADPSKVVERAAAYHSFLVGTGTAANVVKGNGAAAPSTAGAKPAGAAAGTKPANAAGAKPANAAGAKPANAAGAKPANAAGAKPANAAGAKPVGGAKPAGAAAGAKAAPKSSAPIPMTEVTAALYTVINAIGGEEGKVAARALLKRATGGAQSVKDVKPEQYKAVIDACAEEVTKLAAKEAVADPTGDEFDAAPAIDPDDTAVDTDPPEHTGNGASADGEDL